MIAFVRIALLTLLIASATAAFASEVWHQRVQWYLAQYERSAAAPKPIVYPQLAERVRQQFPSDAAVHVSWTARQADGKVVEGELYSRPGELFVISSPNAFVRVGPTSDGSLILRLKKPIEGFESVSVTEAPLWFRGLAFRNPATGHTGTISVSPPRVVADIPAEVVDRMKAIRFEPTDGSLRRHLKYL